MQSLPAEVGSSSAPGDAGGSVVQVCFPGAQASVLDSLNRQREDGQLCDLSIHVQGQVFKAHRCVLAASSPYFHDQVLLKNMSTVSIPAVMDPLAFESVLSCAYTGQLRMLRDDIVNYLTVGSVLQMWHIVDKCTELLKESRASAGGGGGGSVLDAANAGGGSANLRCSSSNSDGGSGDAVAVSEGKDGDQAQVAESQEPHRAPQPPSRPSVSESQSPSSTNYFSPRDGSAFGGRGAAVAGPSADDGGQSNTPSYCTPSGGEEAFLVEEEEEEIEEEEEEEVLYHQRKRGRGEGSGRRKKIMPEQGVGVSDSFGVSSYQDGEDTAVPLQKRPTYIQPSIMPRKQWVVVKSERIEDDDLIVVSGEEGGEEEEDDEERELELSREKDRTDFNISNVRSLSAELAGRSESEMDAQMDYCQSSEDYLKYEGNLMDQTLAQHLHDSATGQSQSANRAMSALLGQVQSAAAARAQLFPLDMQGNQILLYSQASGLGLDAASAPLGMTGGMVGGGSFKSPTMEHGAVHLSVQSGLAADGMEAAGISGSAGTSSSSGGNTGGSGKVFMCHCGKTFTHKSMRDRHINMHLDLRPFHCPVCAKKFKMKHHLTEHMKTHTGLKPYDCPGCGKKFMWRDSFMRHRSHCDRRSGARDGREGGCSGEGGRRGGEDGSDLMAASHLLLSASEGGQGGVLGGAGGGGVSSTHLSGAVSAQHPVAGSSSSSSVVSGGAGSVLLGVISQSAGQGSGMFADMGLGRSVCDDDVCEVGDHDSVA
ncbi:zinc finger and BTB domain-containing protein 22b [Thalassophryne amazonica]|uniref:zinc finger and BTB domain-containing protein 22b n=1 Tax=Thalassophryne amazonica TaxID=390379 RepID=UPI0014722B31|nr:zinc finger and BTB domain-containing protein 22b [Thalassophryne amazonica]XP_034016836.1 zinc finger and BTB domain-containing protein 22b [Thalassophryne amazonica]